MYELTCQRATLEPPAPQMSQLLAALRGNRHDTDRLLGAVPVPEAELGDLDRIQRIIKVFGMVNVARGFDRTPAVLDGCSDLLVEVFGDAGRHNRAAVGLAKLPVGIAVEVELIARLRT